MEISDPSIKDLSDGSVEKSTKSVSCNGSSRLNSESSHDDVVSLQDEEECKLARVPMAKIKEQIVGIPAELNQPA